MMFGFGNDGDNEELLVSQYDEEEADPEILIYKELKEHNKQMKELIKAINKLSGRIK